MQGGSILDATIIAAPSSTKNKDGKRDPEDNRVIFYEKTPKTKKYKKRCKLKIYCFILQRFPNKNWYTFIENINGMVSDISRQETGEIFGKLGNISQTVH